MVLSSLNNRLEDLIKCGIHVNCQTAFGINQRDSLEKIAINLNKTENDKVFFGSYNISVGHISMHDLTVGDILRHMVRSVPSTEHTWKVEFHQFCILISGVILYRLYCSI